MSYVVGHKRNIELLKKILTGPKRPHALLFVGREGIGKKRVAILCGAMFLCEKKEGCLSCRHCKRVLEGVHPDFRLEAPKGKRAILIDQIRELKEWAFMAPMEGRGKVAVVDDAHLMNQQAANAFLKTLEEPPENTLFILITSEPSMLLPTIVSRCQTIRFSPLSREEVEEICEREGVQGEIRKTCVETGSLMFLGVREEQIERARALADRMLQSPSLRMMGEGEAFKDQKSFMLLLFWLRRELNKRLAKTNSGRLWELHRRMKEVERLAYSSNVSPRSLYDYLLMGML